MIKFKKDDFMYPAMTRSNFMKSVMVLYMHRFGHINSFLIVANKELALSLSFEELLDKLEIDYLEKKDITKIIIKDMVNWDSENPYHILAIKESTFVEGKHSSNIEMSVSEVETKLGMAPGTLRIKKDS